MAQVYVSYGGRDRGSALPVIEAMNQAGLDVWHYGMISPGVSFLEQMRRELDNAKCVVVLWSKAAAESDFLQQETGWAIQAWSSERLVLAALDDTSLPMGLRDLSPISIRNASDSGTKELIERIQDIVAEAEPPIAVATAVAPPPATQRKLARAPASRFRRFGRIIAAEALAALIAGIAVMAGAAAILTFIVFVDSPTSSHWGAFPWGGGSIGGGGTDVLLFFLLIPAVLVFGVAIGAGATYIAWLNRRSDRTPSMKLLQVPVASNGVRVFVSYSRQDGRTVEQLVRQIEELGHTVWIDRQSSSAQRYAASIAAAIRTSRVVALMCSQNAFTSDHVIREIYVAGDYKKPFIVFQLDLTKVPDEILYFVSGFPRLPIATVDQQQLRSEIARLLAA